MKGTNKASQASLLWHPNFRVVETLPDTKVIRTSFLVNAVAVTVMLLVIIAFAWRVREYTEVQALLGAVETGGVLKSVEDNRPKLAQMRKLQGDFSVTEKKVREIEAFVAAPFAGSELLQQVAQTLPRLIVVNEIEYGGSSVMLKGSLVGSSERATVLAKQYVAQLTQDPFFAARMDKVRLSSLEREKTTGRLAFEIEMTLKPRK